MSTSRIGRLPCWRPNVASRRPGLFLSQFGAMLQTTMKTRLARQLVVMFLAVFVTVGMGLSVAQATDMTAKMAMASDMDGSGHDGCQGCPAGGDNGMKAMTCTPICVAPILAAVLAQAAPAMMVHKPVSFAARYPLLHGRTSPPDPYPPRFVHIG